MSRVVVDACIVSKWFLPEHDSEQAASLLQSQHDLMCPAWMLAELANVLWKSHRRGLISDNDAREILQAVTSRMPLTFYPVEDLLQPALELALGLGITVYEGLYVALALSTQSLLVTSDKALIKAVEQSPWARCCISANQLPI